MVTTSNHVLVNMAVFADVLEIEGDVLTSKQSHEDDDKSGGGSDGTSGTSASAESDAAVVPEKRRRRGAYHKSRPLASLQLSPALQSELKKLRQVATRGSGVSKAECDLVCEAANKAISLLQLGSRTSDVAATFLSRATGMRGHHVSEVFEMDTDGKCKHEDVENETSGEEDPTESKTQPRTTLTTWKPSYVETTQSVLQLHFEDDYRRRCEQCIRRDFRGSMNRLRQHQQVRDVMVSVSRK